MSTTETEISQEASKTLAEKLRGHAAAIRAGAISAEDHEWFAASLERLACDADAVLHGLNAALVEVEDAGPKALKYAEQELRAAIARAERA